MNPVACVALSESGVISRSELRLAGRDSRARYTLER